MTVDFCFVSGFSSFYNSSGNVMFHENI
jgi:hypothetical protein